jgi:putative resolvase
VFLEDKAQNFEQTLAKDVLEIITVFSAKLYGSRSHKKRAKK